MCYEPTAASAIAYTSRNQLEEWVHLFLCKEGGNIPLSHGLKLDPRRYFGPQLMNLDLFQRCCGPEKDMKFRVSASDFHAHVAAIARKYNEGNWDMPPLIVYRAGSAYMLSDGNHRLEALKILRVNEYWVIIWETDSHE